MKVIFAVSAIATGVVASGNAVAGAAGIFAEHLWAWAIPSPANSWN